MIRKNFKKARKAKPNKIKRRRTSSHRKSVDSAGGVSSGGDTKPCDDDANMNESALHTFFDESDVENNDVTAVSNDAVAKGASKSLNDVKECPKERRKRKRPRLRSNGSAGKRHKGNDLDSSFVRLNDKIRTSAPGDPEKEIPGSGISGKITSLLAADVKRNIIDCLSATPSFIKLSFLDHHWSDLCAEQSRRWSRICPSVDVARFFRNNNPFLRHFVEDDCRGKAKAFHDDVRLVVRMLLKLAQFQSDGMENCKFKLENFTPKAVGWSHSYSEDQLPICPVILREKIRDLFLIHFNRTSKYIYSEPFFDSAMFINMVYHCQDKVTSLNLGDLKGAERILRCTFSNLEELVWHSAELDDLVDLKFPKLSVLSLTAESSSMFGFNILKGCPSLSYLYTGLRVPDNPTRFDLDVLLRCYQAFWNSSASVGDGGDDNDTDKSTYIITTFPKLNFIGFWNVPEKLFAIMGRCGIRFETLQFGQLNQALTRLCSLDSVMQALFKFNQPKYECCTVDVCHLRMYLHAMPVVSLDYYLPQLMMGINDALCSIRSLDLFVHCTFSATMPSSWVLDGRFKNSRSKLKQLTHFSLHIDGFCVFDDLDCHLPTCLTCVSISISLPIIGATKSVASLLSFIKRLADVNAYPDLEELHLQVWGVRCAESLLNQVADHLSDIRRLSVIAMPVEEQRDRLVDLIKHVASSCPRLVSLNLSAEMTRLLLEKYGDFPHQVYFKKEQVIDLWRKNWKLAIARLGADCDLTDSCELGVGSLPRIYGCDEYVVTPHYPEVPGCFLSYSDEENEEESECREPDDDDSDSDSNDSFVVDGSEEEPEEDDDDDIDHCDRLLEDETNRRHERYLKRKARQPSTSSEDAEEQQENEDGSDVEYITDYEDEEESQSNYMHPMIDGEAEEVESGMESSDQSDAEPEGEDIVYSSDQEMLEAEAQMVNVKARRNPSQTRKKKRIIESDSD